MMERSDQRTSETEFVAFDLETTGLSPQTCRIVEYGAVRFRIDGREVASVQQLLDPGCPIPSAAARVHHISDAMVRGWPKIADVLPELLGFFGGPETVLLAHNASFDLGFLDAAIRTAGCPAPRHCVLDTVSVARCCLPRMRSYRLESLARALGVADREEHRALADARLLRDVFLKMLSRHPKLADVRELFSLVSAMSFATPGAIAARRAVREELTLAIQRQATIVMLYEGVTRGPLERRVTPRVLEEAGSLTYLLAFCHADQMEKTYRLDKIREVREG